MRAYQRLVLLALTAVYVALAVYGFWIPLAAWTCFLTVLLIRSFLHVRRRDRAE